MLIYLYAYNAIVGWMEWFMSKMLKRWFSCRAATAGNELLLLLVWHLSRHCLGFNLVLCGQVPLELQGQFFSISIFGLQGAFTSGPASLSDIATHVPKSSLEADLMQEMRAAGLRSSAQQAGAWLSGVRPGFPGTFSFWWGLSQSAHWHSPSINFISWMMSKIRHHPQQHHLSSHVEISTESMELKNIAAAQPGWCVWCAHKGL